MVETLVLQESAERTVGVRAAWGAILAQDSQFTVPSPVATIDTL
jgi:hypothetical protein